MGGVKYNSDLLGTPQSPSAVMMSQRPQHLYYLYLFYPKQRSPLPGSPASSKVAAFPSHKHSCSFAGAALCRFFSLHSHQPPHFVRTAVGKHQPRFLLFSSLSSPTGCRSKCPRLTPTGRAWAWLPAVVQYRGNNIHSSNAGLIQAVSCFFHSI